MSKHLPVALADNVSVEFVSYMDLDPVGVYILHEREPGLRCVCTVMLDNLGQVRRAWAEDKPPWATVVAMFPLTLDEQVTCPACGFTGWVHAGRWIPA